MIAEGNKARTVLHADESFRDVVTGRYWVVAITEDEPGFRVVCDWDNLADAKMQADKYNAAVGLADDERAIRISSMAASIAAEEE